MEVQLLPIHPGLKREAVLNWTRRSDLRKLKQSSKRPCAGLPSLMKPASKDLLAALQFSRQTFQVDLILVLLEYCHNFRIVTHNP